MMAVYLADGPLVNYLFDVPSIIIYTILAGIFFKYYENYEFKGFFSIAMGLLVLATHHFLKFFFYYFFQDRDTFTSQLFLRLILLSWGLSFAFMLHGIIQFRYKNSEALLLLVYVFYGAFMGLALLLPEINLITDEERSANVLVVPEAIIIMTTIIHYVFIYELIMISKNSKKDYHYVSKAQYYWLLNTGAIILIIWLSIIFSNGIVEMPLIEPFIPLLGFSLWSYGLFKHPNYLFYPKYIPHVLLVSRIDGTFIYHHDFYETNKINHHDNFPDFTLISGLFASLRMASIEIFSEFNNFMFYDMGKSTAVIYQYDDFLITLLVNDRIHWYETLLEKFGTDSSHVLNGIRRNFTMNLCQPVQEVFGLPT